MRIVDTHAHLYCEDFETDLHEVILRANSAGVENILLPNIDEKSIPQLKKATQQYPDFFVPMMGLHPTSVSENWQQQLDVIYEELNTAKYAAIGEIGIDLYWDTSLKNQQIAAFEEQLAWSIEKRLPVAIHSRNSLSEVIESIKKVGEKNLFGVFHSFGGNADELAEILQLKNFLVGINGVVTFKKSGLTETLRHTTPEKIVLETDSPWLAPTPYRGKRNESAYLKEILTKLAEIFGKSEEEIAEITTQNAYKLFEINKYYNKG